MLTTGGMGTFMSLIVIIISQGVPLWLGHIAHLKWTLFRFVLFFLNFFKVQSIHNVVSISAVQQSDPVTQVYTFFSHSIFRHVLS